jgi:ABC-type phosphate/phosphonate transport system substrate-binding protein
VAIALANQAGGGSVARWKQGVKRAKGPSGVRAGHTTLAVRRWTRCRQAVDEAARLLVIQVSQPINSAAKIFSSTIAFNSRASASGCIS